MNIDIDQNLVGTLDTLAAANSTTSEEYAAGVLNAHLASALRQSVVDNVYARPVSEVATIAASVEDSVQAIEEARPVVKESPLIMP